MAWAHGETSERFSYGVAEWDHVSFSGDVLAGNEMTRRVVIGGAPLFGH